MKAYSIYIHIHCSCLWPVCIFFLAHTLSNSSPKRVLLRHQWATCSQPGKTWNTVTSDRHVYSHCLNTLNIQMSSCPLCIHTSLCCTVAGTKATCSNQPAPRLRLGAAKRRQSDQSEYRLCWKSLHMGLQMVLSTHVPCGYCENIGSLRFFSQWKRGGCVDSNQPHTSWYSICTWCLTSECKMGCHFKC